jgi:hypothetical protein
LEGGDYSMNSQSVATGMASIAFAIVVSGVLAMLSVNKYLQMKAFDDCAQASSYTFETKSADGTTARSIEPNHKFYVTCITDKGYKTAVTQ